MGGDWPRGEEEGREAGTGKWHGNLPCLQAALQEPWNSDCPGLLPPSLALARHPVRQSPVTTGALLCCSCHVECSSHFLSPSNFSERPLDPHPPQVAPEPPPPATHSLPACLPTPPSCCQSVCPAVGAALCAVDRRLGAQHRAGLWGHSQPVPLRVVLSCNGRSEQAVAGSWWRGQAAPQRGLEG